jgi:aspartate kinase
MLVYKFGGASIKDAKSIHQMTQIVNNCNENLVIVISAMGKTTNLLEKITRSWFDQKPYKDYFEELKFNHQKIIHELFEEHIPSNLDGLYNDLADKLRTKPSMDFQYEYDQIVSFGEKFSTRIIAAYFNLLNTPAEFIDITEVIKTDRNFRNAGVLWDLTQKLSKERFTFSTYNKYITQGFLGGTTNNQITTLGREGSDYSAALIAAACEAEKLVVWKDVPGIMNADPAWFSNPEKIDFISYKEAIELTYYGAKVIHPKTIKPLQEANIPLYVNSFVEPDKTGTIITNESDKKFSSPVFIRKQNQVLISIRPKTPDFVAETDISHLFQLLVDLNIAVQLTQMSAATFTICIDKNEFTFDQLLLQLNEHYEVRYNEASEIITVRNYNDESLAKMKEGYEVLIEQKTRKTAQIVRIENQTEV